MKMMDQKSGQKKSATKESMRIKGIHESIRMRCIHSLKELKPL